MLQISDLFVDPESLPDNFGGFVQLLFLMVCYAFFLYNGSHLISDGSELLLLVPSIAGIVGSVVLPVLGAVPDGAIVVFSGLGPDPQKQLNIGVGALAGSSVMLITLPWCFAILRGRVDLDANGMPVYKKPAGAGPGWTKLTPNAGWRHTLFGSGIEINKPMRTNAAIMLFTALAYVIIQVPAFDLGCGEGSDCEHASGEKWWAFGGFMFAIICFFAYLVYQVRVGGEEEFHQDMMTDAVANQIAEGHVNVAQAFFAFVNENKDAYPEDGIGGLASTRTLLENEASSPAAGVVAPPPAGAHVIGIHHGASALKLHRNGSIVDLTPKQRAERRLKHMLKRFYKKYDKNGDGLIDVMELQLLLVDLGQKMSTAGVQELFKSMDGNQSGGVDFDEFCAAVLMMVQHPDVIKKIDEKTKVAPLTAEQMLERKASKQASKQGSMVNLHLAVNGGASAGAVSSSTSVEEHVVPSSPVLAPHESSGADIPLAPVVAADEHEEDSDIEEDEAEEVPEDLRELDPAQQQTAIKKRAGWMMALGTIMIIVFSDPMVDCLSNLGERTHIPGFYVAFLLAPLAANASELLASVNYAAKKTPATITISIASLLGSGTMNNCFCLAIFLMLIFAKNLQWVFSAETIAILVVQVIVSLMSLKKVHRVIDGIFILSLYPISMGLVAILENVAGLN